MIFVTVGTHEQPFDRLVQYLDEQKAAGIITEEVIIQTGYSNYEPVHCTWSKLLPYAEMVKNVEQARIVITHGGPSSFIMPLQVGKTPVVVPRQEKFGEHVNDHQLIFARQVEQRQKNIIVVEDVNDLSRILLDYDTIVSSMNTGLNSNNQAFCDTFSKIAESLIKDVKK